MSIGNFASQVNGEGFEDVRFQTSDFRPENVEDFNTNKNPAEKFCGIFFLLDQG